PVEVAGRAPKGIFLSRKPVGTPSLVGRFSHAVLARLAKAPRSARANVPVYNRVADREARPAPPQTGLLCWQLLSLPAVDRWSASALPGRARMSRFPAGTGAT